MVSGDGCSIVLVNGGREVGIGRVVGVRPDMALVDALARLHLVARRNGYALMLREPCAELRDVLELAGLSDLLIDEADR